MIEKTEYGLLYESGDKDTPLPRRQRYGVFALILIMLMLIMLLFILYANEDDPNVSKVSYLFNIYTYT